MVTGIQNPVTPSTNPEKAQEIHHGVKNHQDLPLAEMLAALRQALNDILTYK